MSTAVIGVKPLPLNLSVRTGTSAAKCWLGAPRQPLSAVAAAAESWLEAAAEAHQCVAKYSLINATLLDSLESAAADVSAAALALASRSRASYAWHVASYRSQADCVLGAFPNSVPPLQGVR